jgi:copper chaperone CopZ
LFVDYHIMTNMHRILVPLIAAAFIACGYQSEQKPAAQAPAAQAQTPAQEATATASIDLPTIRCGTCERHITAALGRAEGVKSVSVSHETKKAEIVYVSSATNVDRLENVITKSGYDANGKKRDDAAYQDLPECCR